MIKEADAKEQVHNRYGDQITKENTKQVHPNKESEYQDDVPEEGVDAEQKQKTGDNEAQEFNSAEVHEGAYEQRRVIRETIIDKVSHKGYQALKFKRDKEDDDVKGNLRDEGSNDEDQTSIDREDFEKAYNQNCEKVQVENFVLNDDEKHFEDWIEVEKFRTSKYIPRGTKKKMDCKDYLVNTKLKCFNRFSILMDDEDTIDEPEIVIKSLEASLLNGPTPKNKQYLI